MKKYLFLISFTAIAWNMAVTQSNWSTAGEAVNWLNSQIKTVRQNDLTFTQSMAVNFNEHYYSTVSIGSVNAGGKTTDDRYEFYLEHINPNNMQPIISGKTLVVELNAIQKDRLIKHYKGDEFSGYVSSFKIYFEDIQVARNAIEALRFVSGTNPSSELTFNSDAEAYDWLMRHIKVSRESAKRIENIVKVLTESGNKIILTSKESDMKGTMDEKVYEFYLADFNSNSFQLKTSSSKLGIAFTSTGQLKPIKFFHNGIQKNYTNKFEIYGSDPLNMLHIIAAFRYLKGGESIPVPSMNTGSHVPVNQETPVQNNTLKEVKTEVSVMKTVNAATVPTPEFALRPYSLLANNTLADLDRTDAQLDTKIKGMGYGGLEYFFTAFTPASTVRFSKNNIPVLLFKADPGIDPAEILSLAKGEVKKDRRRFIQGSMKLTGKTRDVGDAYMGLSFIKLKDDLYQIVLPEDIEKGEYAFMPINSSASPFTAGSKVRIACFAIE